MSSVSVHGIPPRVAEFVYFIRIGKRGPVKIGHAADPVKRISDLQIANPFKLELLGCIRGGLREELALHRRFSVYRIRGEWFSSTKEVMTFIRATLGEQGVPLEIVKRDAEAERSLPNRWAMEREKALASVDPRQIARELTQQGRKRTQA